MDKDQPIPGKAERVETLEDTEEVVHKPLYPKLPSAPFEDEGEEMLGSGNTRASAINQRIEDGDAGNLGAAAKIEISVPEEDEEVTVEVDKNKPARRPRRRNSGDSDEMSFVMSAPRASIDKLKGRENYDEWSVSARSYLVIRNLWKYCVSEPTARTAAAHERVISEIILMVESRLYSYIKNTGSAKTVWEGLRDAFADPGTSRKVTILNNLVSTKLSSVGDMESYVNTILLLWHKTQVAGFNIE